VSEPIVSRAAEDLLRLARLLVDDPRAVDVEANEDAEGPVELRLRVAPDDRGKVIGRRGRTIDALRALAEVRGELEGREYDLDVVDD